MPEAKAEPRQTPKKTAELSANKAAALLEEAAGILHRTTGKNKDAYEYVAAQVDWCREKVLENV